MRLIQFETLERSARKRDGQALVQGERVNWLAGALPASVKHGGPAGPPRRSHPLLKPQNDTTTDVPNKTLFFL